MWECQHKLCAPVYPSGSYFILHLLSTLTNSWRLSHLQGPFSNLLGVSVFSNLSWTAHIDSVCSKAKRQVGLLHRQFHNASPSCKDQLYKSLVLPILDYCSSLWDPNYAIHVSKLESVQKFAARFVTGRWSGSYDSLLSHLKWPKLSTRRKKQKLLLCNLWPWDLYE